MVAERPKRRRTTSRALLAAAGFAAAASVSLAASPAGAAPGDDAVRWREEWPRVRTTEIIATEVLLAGHILLSRVSPDPVLRTRGGVLFDEPARDALRLETPDARGTAARISDGFLYSMIAYPLVVDSLIVGGIGHGSSDVFLQSGLISLQSFAITAALTSSAKVVVGRERPSSRHCHDGSYGADCGGGRTRSYFSGHAAVTATGAGLICVHHQHLPLYGGGAADALACGLGLSVAGATGLLRIMADKHHASDVLAGTVVGLVSGYVVPRLLHYRGSPQPDPPPTDLTPMMLGYSGAF